MGKIVHEVQSAHASNKPCHLVKHWRKQKKQLHKQGVAKFGLIRDVESSLHRALQLHRLLSAIDDLDDVRFGKQLVAVSATTSDVSLTDSATNACCSFDNPCANDADSDDDHGTGDVTALASTESPFQEEYEADLAAFFDNPEEYMRLSQLLEEAAETATVHEDEAAGIGADNTPATTDNENLIIIEDLSFTLLEDSISSQAVEEFIVTESENIPVVIIDDPIVVEEFLMHVEIENTLRGA